MPRLPPRSPAWGTLTLSLTLVAGPAFGQVYDPEVILSASLTNVAQSASVNLLDLGSSSKPGLVSQSSVGFDNGAGVISYSGTSGIYSGNVAGVSAAPYIGNAPTTGNYFAAQPNGSISISYAQSQRYFGMAWGSVDTYNSLTFYRGNTVVEQIPGKAISNAAAGDQGLHGTYYVNMNFTGASSFDRVVATSSSPAFEFNVVAYSTQTQAITVAQVEAAQAAGKVEAPHVVTVNPAPLAASPLLVPLLAWFRRRRARAGMRG